MTTLTSMYETLASVGSRPVDQSPCSLHHDAKAGAYTTLLHSHDLSASARVSAGLGSNRPRPKTLSDWAWFV